MNQKIYDEIYEKINNFNNSPISSNYMDEGEIEKLRQTIRAVLKEKKYQNVQGPSFETKLYDLAISLTQNKPKNNVSGEGELEDPIMQLPFPKKNQICTSDGYIFDIETLVQSINHKHGKFENPITREEFLPQDQENIKKFAKEKGLQFQDIPYHPSISTADILSFLSAHPDDQHVPILEFGDGMQSGFALHPEVTHGTGGTPSSNNAGGISVLWYL